MRGCSPVSSQRQEFTRNGSGGVGAAQVSEVAQQTGGVSIRETLSGQPVARLVHVAGRELMAARLPCERHVGARASKQRRQPLGLLQRDQRIRLVRSTGAPACERVWATDQARSGPSRERGPPRRAWPARAAAGSRRCSRHSKIRPPPHVADRNRNASRHDRRMRQARACGARDPRDRTHPLRAGGRSAACRARAPCRADSAPRPQGISASARGSRSCSLPPVP